jgi:hypothetical protein
MGGETGTGGVIDPAGGGADVGPGCDPLETSGTLTCGLGVCAATVPACDADGMRVPCSPGIPADEETCDGSDDDCDGEVDEGCTCTDGALQSCYTGSAQNEGVGECQSGAQTCAGGQWGACIGDVLPSAELCDGLDNDCDGAVDDGNPEGGNGCLTGQPGQCSAGLYVCSGGQLACQPVNPSSSEVCDGLDNDCDGSVDEGNPGGGGACSTGLPGICAAGAYACSGGGATCVQTTQATAEVCGNGLDDDCDGQVDESCGCPHSICTVGPTGTPFWAGCDAPGTCVAQICAADSYCCASDWDSVCVSEVTSICGLGC